MAYLNVIHMYSDVYKFIFTPILWYESCLRYIRWTYNRHCIHWKENKHGGSKSEAGQFNY